MLYPDGLRSSHKSSELLKKRQPKNTSYNTSGLRKTLSSTSLYSELSHTFQGIYFGWLILCTRTAIRIAMLSREVSIDTVAFTFEYFFLLPLLNPQKIWSVRQSFCWSLQRRFFGARALKEKTFKDRGRKQIHRRTPIVAALILIPTKSHCKFIGKYERYVVKASVGSLPIIARCTWSFLVAIDQTHIPIIFPCVCQTCCDTCNTAVVSSLLSQISLQVDRESNKISARRKKTVYLFCSHTSQTP